MNALNSRQLSPLVALAFRIAGIIMVIGPFLDIAILPIPYQMQNRAWVVESITVAVDRGFVPMLGIALIISGAWVSSLSNTEPKATPSWRSLQFWAVILASVLAAFYMLLTIFHTSNVLTLQSERLSSITEQAAEAEQQLETQIDEEVGQRRQQVQELLRNDQLREQVISQGLISPEDAEQLQAFQEDPERLNVFLQGLDDQAAGLRTERQTEIGVQREEAQQAARATTMKAISRVSISSIILAIGYGLMGWTGLRLYLRGSM
ncbi:MAG: HpsJ family protein [Cyanobacteria bacterium P01_E01_bin.6]